MPLRVLIIVENLPVPLDRRVWQQACALRDAGHDVTVICPQMRGWTTPFEVMDGITTAKGVWDVLIESPDGAETVVVPASAWWLWPAVTA